jgi:hypothetical protein
MFQRKPYCVAGSRSHECRAWFFAAPTRVTVAVLVVSQAAKPMTEMDTPSRSAITSTVRQVGLPVSPKWRIRAILTLMTFHRAICRDHLIYVYVINDSNINIAGRRYAHASAYGAVPCTYSQMSWAE